MHVLGLENALNIGALSLDSLGHLVIAHLDRFRSRCAHSEDFCSLLI